MTDKKPVKKTTLVIDEDLLNQIKVLAAADDRSVNSLIIKLLKTYIKDSEANSN